MNSFSYLGLPIFKARAVLGYIELIKEQEWILGTDGLIYAW